MAAETHGSAAPSAGRVPAGRRPGRTGKAPKALPEPRTVVTTFRAQRLRAPGPARALRHFRRALDRPLTPYYLIMGSAALIITLGLVMVFSASQITARFYGLPYYYFFEKQLLAVSLGVVLIVVAVRLPPRVHRSLAYPLLLVTILLLLAVMVAGTSVNGNRNWLSLGGSFQIQPSEFAKLALVLWGADLLTRKGRLRMLDQWKHLLVPLVPVSVLLLALVLVGGDMGTAMILCAVAFGLLWFSGAPARLFGTTAMVAAAVSALMIALVPHRLSRLSCIGATKVGADDACYQAVHGIYALASGGLFGTGLGASVEKWGQLPEPHTDFIFAVTGEELGLAGTLSVLVLFAALGYAGIRVAGRTRDPFIRYAAGGATTWIMAQAVINMGAVLGLLPIAGVPLPMFSYGGSALLPTMFAVGMLLCFARSEPAARAALAARSTARSRLRGLPRRTITGLRRARPRRER